MPENPPISVLMTAFNQKPAYLKKAIESILGQTFSNFEFIIVDDGSIDEHSINTLNDFAAKDPRIKLVRRSKNFGCINSLNKVLTNGIIQGEYIARMDSDDISEPDRLQIEYDFMKKNPDCAFVGSWATIIDENGKILGKRKGPTDYATIKKNIFKYNFFTNPSCFFRKSLIDKVGAYSADFGNVEDYEFLLRIIPKYNVANIPRFLVKYRMNLAGLTYNNNKKQELNSIQVRLYAIKNYDYPKRYYFYLIIPALMYLFIPFGVKKTNTENIF